MIEQNFKEKFISLFPLSESNFIEPVIFTKGFGFSVKRKYETGILKKYLGSNENWVSLIKVFIDDNDLSKKIVKIKGSASLYFRGEENFEVNRPRIEKKIFGPIDLFSEGEFFFSTENFHFFSKTKKSEVPTLDILKYLYDCHIKPTRTFYGLYLRLKLLDQLIDGLIFSALALIFQILLKVISGIWYDYNVYLEEFSNEFNGKRVEKEVSPPGPTVPFFNYNANIWPITIFCGFHLLIYFSFSMLEYQPVILKDIFKNNFLTITYSIFALVFIDRILPNLIKKSIKYLRLSGSEIRYRKFEI